MKTTLAFSRHWLEAEITRASTTERRRFFVKAKSTNKAVASMTEAKTAVPENFKKGL